CRRANPAGTRERIPALPVGMADARIAAAPAAQLPRGDARRAVCLRRAGICEPRALSHVARARHADGKPRRAAVALAENPTVRFVISAEPAKASESRNPVIDDSGYWIPGSRAALAPRNDEPCHICVRGKSSVGGGPQTVVLPGVQRLGRCGES